MHRILLRFTLMLLPILYMYWVWYQSSTFNPSLLEGIHTEIGIPIFLMLGAALEIGHLFEFAILYFLLIMCFLTFGRLSKGKEAVAFIFSLLYGVLDEIHQYYVPFRSTSATDLIKDTVGIVVIWYFIHRTYYGKKHTKLGAFLKGITNTVKKSNNHLHL